LPIEGYLAAATSARPLDEEPFDIDDLERVLAREDLDIETNIMLVRIFEKLVRRSDPEVALFAAESINLIESRYNRQIEQTREDIKETSDLEAHRRLARLYFDMARLYERAGSIRNFYLRESYGAIKEVARIGKISLVDARIAVRTLLGLGLDDQAAATAARFAQSGNPEMLLLQAEVEFRRGDILKVFQICGWLAQRKDQLSRDAAESLEYWLGSE
jgi:hypothetical protein